MTDDAELLRRYAYHRNEAAFAEFVSRHLGLVYFAALRRTGGNAALAEDVAQAVFTAAARDAGTLARHAVVTGWLYTTRGSSRPKPCAPNSLAGGSNTKLHRRARSSRRSCDWGANATPPQRPRVNQSEVPLHHVRECTFVAIVHVTA